jgi:hypothetical protein
LLVRRSANSLRVDLWGLFQSHSLNSSTTSDPLASPEAAGAGKVSPTRTRCHRDHRKCWDPESTATVDFITQMNISNSHWITSIRRHHPPKNHAIISRNRHRRFLPDSISPLSSHARIPPSASINRRSSIQSMAHPNFVNQSDTARWLLIQGG